MTGQIRVIMVLLSIYIIFAIYLIVETVLVVLNVRHLPHARELPTVSEQVSLFSSATIEKSIAYSRAKLWFGLISSYFSVFYCCLLFDWAGLL